MFFGINGTFGVVWGPKLSKVIRLQWLQGWQAKGGAIWGVVLPPEDLGTNEKCFSRSGLKLLLKGAPA